MADQPGMGVEVELKFRVADPQGVRDALQRLGGRSADSVEQVDTYFAHPARDFATTDEALRLRLVGDWGGVTYKGPLLDRETKSREETEIAFTGGAADAKRFAHVLERLGFRPVREVRKTRQAWSIAWDQCDVEIAFDDVTGLGTFVELETTSSRDGFEMAKQAVLALAEKLDLRDPERRSYLALLLSSDRA
ncbi:MAG: class IV adenylate cyclase [Planctomycetaceae bacterium]